MALIMLIFHHRLFEFILYVVCISLGSFMSLVLIKVAWLWSYLYLLVQTFTKLHLHLAIIKSDIVGIWIERKTTTNFNKNSNVFSSSWIFFYPTHRCVFLLCLLFIGFYLIRISSGLTMLIYNLPTASGFLYQYFCLESFFLLLYPFNRFAWRT